MKKTSFLLIAVSIAVLSCKSSKTNSTASTTSKTAPSTGPVLAKFGNNFIYTSDFEYVYKKNNANAEDAYTNESLKDYLNLYTNFRLKVKEAETLGLDTVSSFKKELDGYKRQLAQPYLTEKGVTEQLTKEAYERMKEEINASHILISVSPEADPKDTLVAYNKIEDIRKKALAGEDFGKLAQQYSEDPSAKSNKGNLGYFTALQMVYPFEEAAYKTPTGQISNPIRTRFGYHILKVNGRRPSQGQVRVAHIMVRATSGLTESDSLAAKQKIDEIYNKLKAGESWNNMVSQFSDDVNSKPKNGELPWFSTGRMIPSFEDASFKLQKVDDISQPVLTPYGWHIIKLLEKKNLETFKELEPTIKSKVSKDSRSELNKTVLIQRLRKENNFVENPKAVQTAINAADNTLLEGNFAKKVDEKDNAVLFTIKNDKYTTNDFFEYVKSNQKAKKGASASFQMQNLYRDYTNAKIMAYEEAHLEEKYVDYKMLVREYRDGILLFQLMDDKVWSKAIDDTAGLKDFYSKNSSNYKWGTRAHTTIYNVKDASTLNKLTEELKKTKYAINAYKVDPVYFDAGKASLTDEMKKKSDQLLPILVKDKSLLVELTGSSENKEIGGLSKQRIDSVKAYLISRGISADRIITKDLEKLPIRKNASEKALDRKVTFGIYSTSKKALETIFNEKAPLTLQITEGTFQKGDNPLLDSIAWKEGVYTVSKDDRINYIIINKVDEPRNKTFEEARGLSISDYQTYLEKEWISNLKKKYPVTVNEEEFKKMVKK